MTNNSQQTANKQPINNPMTNPSATIEEPYSSGGRDVAVADGDRALLVHEDRSTAAVPKDDGG